MNLEKIQKDLADAVAETDKAKEHLAKLEGQELEVLRQMQEETGLLSVEEAGKEILNLDSLLKEKMESIEKDYNKLKAEYDW